MMRALRKYGPLWAGMAIFAAASILMLVLSNHSRAALTTATWIWDAKQIETQTDEMIAFAEENGINLIYLHVEPTTVSPWPIGRLSAKRYRPTSRWRRWAAIPTGR